MNFECQPEIDRTYAKSSNLGIFTPLNPPYQGTLNGTIFNLVNSVRVLGKPADRYFS